MSYDKMASSAVYALFEEIKSKLDKKTVQAVTPVPVVPATPAIRPEDIAEIKEMAATLQQAVETARLPQKHIHKHTIDLMSNKVLVAFTVTVVVVMILGCIIHNQREIIADYKDNDLKYRHIQMKGKAEAEDILMLRDVFDYNRNKETIKSIRSQVEKYEQLVQQQAETETRAKLNTQQAEQIRQEAESMKRRK